MTTSRFVQRLAVAAVVTFALPAAVRAQTPTVTVAATDANASEVAAATGTFTFTRTGSTASTLVVNFTLGGTATNNTDYDFITTNVTFAAGSATATRTVTPNNDALVEGPETVILTLTDGASYDVGAPGAATVTIADNPTPVVTMDATDASASEIGPATGTFTFTRVGDVTFALTVTYTIGGTAVNNSDYDFITTNVTFAAGETTTARTVTPNNDALVEGPETVILTLQDGAHYDVGAAASDTVTIADQPTPIVTMDATDPSASEIGPATGAFTFMRVGDLTFALTVTYTIGGTAVNNSDYDFIITNVTFATGEAKTVRTITPNNDALVEGPETVILTLQDGAHYDVGAAATDTVTIADQPTPIVTIEATDDAASEVGPATGAFTFTRVGDLTFALTLTYAIGGTAVNNSDYDFITTNVTFAAGVATTTRDITPKIDQSAEGPETVILTLQDGAHYDVGAANTGTVTIADGAPPSTTTSTSSTQATSTSTSSTSSTSTTTTPSSSSTTTAPTSTSSSTTSTATTSTSTSTSSSSTSTSTSTSSTVVPTTIAPSACAGASNGPTFVSIGCRLDALLADVQGATALGTFGPKSAQNADKAVGKLADALAACDSGDTKQAKTRLAQVKKALVQYGHRLRGRAARRRLDGAVREEFLAAGETIATDVSALRAALTCPADAAP
jgi:hypothetical protein